MGREYWWEPEWLILRHAKSGYSIGYRTPFDPDVVDPAAGLQGMSPPAYAAWLLEHAPDRTRESRR